MPAMAVAEKTVAPPAPPVRIRCFGDQHYFLTNSPPGTLCDCGTQARIYEPCASCGQMTAARREVKTLRDGVDD